MENNILRVIALSVSIRRAARVTAAAQHRVGGHMRMTYLAPVQRTALDQPE
jgi:hypothetical protein